MAVMRNATSATQFWGSAMVSVPTGGKKKKLNANMAATEAAGASVMPHWVAIRRTATTYVSATVVGLTWISWNAEVITATVATAADRRPRRKARRVGLLAILGGFGRQSVPNPRFADQISRVSWIWL